MSVVETLIITHSFGKFLSAYGTYTLFTTYLQPVQFNLQHHSPLCSFNIKHWDIFRRFDCL